MARCQDYAHTGRYLYLIHEACQAYANPSQGLVQQRLSGARACRRFLRDIHFLQGVARSMPTGAALDRVAKELGVPFFETPTGAPFYSP